MCCRQRLNNCTQRDQRLYSGNSCTQRDLRIYIVWLCLLVHAAQAHNWTHYSRPSCSNLTCCANTCCCACWLLVSSSCILFNSGYVPSVCGNMCFYTLSHTASRHVSGLTSIDKVASPNLLPRRILCCACLSVYMLLACHMHAVCKPFTSYLHATHMLLTCCSSACMLCTSHLHAAYSSHMPLSH